MLDSKIPNGSLADKWTNYQSSMALVSPANKKKYTVLVVGTGLAGSSAAATLSELGYTVKVFSSHDSPRRAHSIAAQGGINAAKNYPGDGDSVHRLFYDTVKGGDFRAREANVHRLAEISLNIIDQCVAQGVPFAREYSGYLENRSFGGAQVSRTFYAKGQTGQQLLLGAYGALMKEVSRGQITLFPRREMMDLVVTDGVATGVVVRDMVTGELETHVGDAVLLCTGGYSNMFYLSTNAKGCNVSAIWRAYKRGAVMANPCFTQIHPTCIPQSGHAQSKLTLMSEGLRNDGRVWVSKIKGDSRPPRMISEDERDYFLERRYPAFGNLVPRDLASRTVKTQCDSGFGFGETGRSVCLDFADAIAKYGIDTIRSKYGNLFEMYERITGSDPYSEPMRIYPAPHYTMGGLWVDYNLMSTIPGLFVLGEANFSDHGANRLGASALMQGLADGYFVIPATLGNYLAGRKPTSVTVSHDSCRSTQNDVKQRVSRLTALNGTRTVDDIHRQLGQVMWNQCGMARESAGLSDALANIPKIRHEFWEKGSVLGSHSELNQTLERAGRIADFLEFSELVVTDALHREESCGGHFRVEHQTDDGEAKRNDDDFCYVGAWEYRGDDSAPILHKEPLVFESIHLSQRSYK